MDDRRRRRLAQESVEDVAPISHSNRQTVLTSEGDCDTVAGSQLRSDVVAEESLIPSALWKVVLLGAISFLAWGALVWFSLQEPATVRDDSLRKAIQENAYRFLSVVSLLLSSQFSFAIWWYRSRSRKDFSGRYRIWLWSGVFWGLTCLSVGIRLHQPLSQLAYERWPVYCWRPELLYWFVPFSIGSLALHQLLSIEMRHSRTSRVLWNFSLCLGIAAAALQLGLDLSLPEWSREVALTGAALLWHLSISSTLLFHARFVVHVTNEAAPRTKSRISRIKAKSIALIHHLRDRVAVVYLGRDGERGRKRELKKQARQQKREELRLERQIKKEEQKRLREEQCLKKKELAAERKARRAADRLSAQQARDVATDREKSATSQQVTKESLGQSGAKFSDKSAAESSGQVPVDQNASVSKTSSGKNRKRVLGASVRIDVPQSVNRPHTGDVVSATSASPKVAQNESVDDALDSDFDEENWDQMSKKQRRQQRKKQRQRSQQQ